MNIGSAIKSIRTKLGMLQSELADKCEISQTALSQIETGKKRPNPRTLTKICSALDVPTSIIYIIAMEDIDVPVTKKAAYELVFPSIKALALQMVDSSHRNLIDEVTV